MGSKSADRTNGVSLCPIEGGSPAVYVYVSNLKISSEWYCKLLDLPIPKQIEDLVILRLSSGANIFLFDRDYAINEFNIRNQNLKALPFPLFSLMAKDKDLNRAKEFMLDNNIDILWSDEETFNIQDPDGNVLMICSI